MKKVGSLLATFLFALGLFSCESENTDDTANLLQSLEKQARYGTGGGTLATADDPDM